MKNSNSDVSSDHVEEWSLAYLEDLLSPEERAKFEQHVGQCEECAKQTEDMSRWVALLKGNKDALCPEEWKLFDYARGGQDVTGVLASHVSHCPSCQKSLEGFRTLAQAAAVPDALWDRMTRTVEHPVKVTTRFPETWLRRLWEQLADFFTPPLALAGAVAAAIIVVVIFYPYSTSKPVLGLSQVSWTPDHAASQLMGEPGSTPAGVIKEKLAIVVYFRNFKHKPAVESVDSFYRLLEPGKEVRLHHDVVSPARVKETVEGAGLKEAGKDEILRLLRDKLSVSRALIVELSQKGNGYAVDAALTDTTTGTVVRERKISDVREAGLSEEMEATTQSVLKPAQ